jgi:hypothetical protein
MKMVKQFCISIRKKTRTYENVFYYLIKIETVIQMNAENLFKTDKNSYSVYVALGWIITE